MTRPKHPPHLIGFSVQRDRTRPDVERAAQWIFLQYVARFAPAVLVTLGAVPVMGEFDDGEVDEPALLRWAEPWHFMDTWCLAHARATWRMWRRYPDMGQTYWCDRDDLQGRLYRARPGRQAPLLSKKPLHFEWLVRYHVLGEPYLRIAGASHDWRDDAWQDTSKPIRSACEILATELSLTLRPAQSGWNGESLQPKTPQ